MNPRVCILGFTVVILFVNQIGYTYYIDNGVVSHDYWRFVHLVDKYYSETLSVSDMLRETNGNFKSLWIPTAFLLDAIVLDLDLITIHFLASCAFAFVTIAVWREFGKCMDNSGYVSVLLLIPILVTCMSPMHHKLLAHGQATLSMYRAALYVFIFLLMGRIFGQKKIYLRETVAIVLLLCVAVMFIGHMYMPAFLATLFLLPLTKLALDRTDFIEKINIYGVIYIFLIGSILIYINTLLIGNMRIGKGLELISADPLAGIQFFFGLYGSSLLGNTARRLVDWQVITIGFAAAGVNLLAILVFLRVRMWKITYFPLLAILYSALVMAAITVARIDRGQGTALAGRYLADTPIWQTGVGFVCGFVILKGRVLFQRPSGHIFSTSLAALFLIVSVVTQGMVLYSQWRAAPSIQRHYERVKTNIRKADELTDEELVKRLSLNKRIFGYSREAIAIMKKYRLNVFREKSME